MNAVAKLNELGQSPWYDNLTRDLVNGGELSSLLTGDGIVGVTSNPSIFEKAMSQGNAYDQQLRELRDLSIEDAYWKLVETDIAGGADLLRPIWESSAGLDGYISIEVSPLLANDTDKTIEQAQDLFRRLNRPNIMIKIPATREGLPAIAETLAEGINVNVTLIFSLARYGEVIDAFVDGVERFVAGGGNAQRLSSVGSFFVSRVDNEVDKRLPEDSPLRGTAAVANAKLAYELFRNRFKDWDSPGGARVQRPLWASTSTKNPAYSDTLYVDELIGPNSVNTLAQASVDALRDHGNPRPNTIMEGLDQAKAQMAGLATAGVDFDDVTYQLEMDGVALFAQAYNDCLETLDKTRKELLGEQ